MNSTVLIALAALTAFCAQSQTQPEHSSGSHEMPHHDADSHSPTHSDMPGLLGRYSMTRDASGTAWQPEGVPMEGQHLMSGDWMFMLHGFAFAVYNHQGGDRGDEKFYSPNMLMGMAQHPLGPGTFGFRSMLSLEPATIGKKGYPELLQTGETADGVTPLIDRQHPHDLFMELATTYSVPVSDASSVFAYFGYPGEPALGPPTFMHRFSGAENPEAPITHHWLDSTHITYGVATLGYLWRQFKIDGSIFTGREPDHNRWNFDRARFDSYAARLTYNPTKAWSMQVSYGNIHSPEELSPATDVERITTSISYHHAWRKNHWQTTLAWGRNVQHPGPDLDAFLVESAANFHETHTIFGRAENVQKDELFLPGTPQDGEVFRVSKLSLGYIYDFIKSKPFKLGIGGSGSVHIIPDSLSSTYGDTPLSFMIFLRAKL